MTRIVRSRIVWAFTALAALALALPAQAQDAVVSGRVVSDRGEPLPAANVVIPELNIQVGTTPAGDYTISVPAARVTGQTVTLRARAIGYQPAASQLTLTAGTHTVNFELRTDVTRLAEVVVTGTVAATEALKVPYSITRMDSAQMPVAGQTAFSQIQGKVPGAQIVSHSGRPGSTPAILLRGPTSINALGRSQAPLVILDGTLVLGAIPDINPNDIESIEVVKGAAGASLYGARAGAGVIHITTKTGRTAQQGIRFGLRTELGTSDVEREFGLARQHTLVYDMTGSLFCSSANVGNQLGCARYINLQDEVDRVNNQPEPFGLGPQGFLNDIGLAAAPDYFRMTGFFNVNPWRRLQDPNRQVLTNQAFMTTTADMRGRLGNTGLYASLGNTTQEGAVRFLDGFRRNSARVNVDHRFGDRVTATVNTYYSTTKEDGAHLDQTTGGIWFNLSRQPWFTNLNQRDDFGRLYIRPNVLATGGQNSNPLYHAENNTRDDEGTRFIGGANVRWLPWEWLNLDGQLSYDRVTGRFFSIFDRNYRSPNPAPGTQAGGVSEGSFDNDSYQIGFAATAQQTFFGDLLGAVTLRTGYAESAGSSKGFSGSNLVVAGLRTSDAATQNQSIGSGETLVKEMNVSTGVQVDWRDRYIASLSFRRDGTSLFGSGNRWASYGRGSVAWIASREPWWPAPDALSLFKLRASQGTTGQRPSFAAQYETFTIGTGGTLNPATLGNRFLRPEQNRETEVGVEMELFNRFGAVVNYAHAKIDGQILQAKPPVASGFQSQWRNVGMLENKTWEASLDIPWIRGRDLTWSSRFIWDQTYSHVTRLDVPPFTSTTFVGGNSFTIFQFREGERIGTFYGQDYVLNCGQLPAPFNAQCSMNSNDASAAFRPNDQGFIVWVGAGNQLTEGITRNLWTTNLPAAQAPWGVRMNFGMPIILRDEEDPHAPVSVALGNGQPKHHLGIAQNVNWRNLSLYALLEGNYGQRVWNIWRHWSFGDLIVTDVDQAGKSVETAKPIGYYWRRGPGIGGAAGIGGLYDILAPNSFHTEKADYMKLREASVNYRLGPIAGTGDWTVGFVGRNLKTWTNFQGQDPETGMQGTNQGPLNTAALTAIAGYRFPNLRTFTLQIATQF